MAPTLDIENFCKTHQLTAKECKGLTNEALGEYAEAFQIFDRDGNGKIDTDEVRTILEKRNGTLTDTDVALMIQSVDLDKDGELDFEEFVLMMVKAQDPSTDYIEAFKVFDTDNSGFIDEHELKAALEKAGGKYSDEEIKEMIASSDLNNDGLISFFEFKTMLELKEQQ